jgi:chromate reductase
VAESVLRGKPAAVVGASTGLFGAVWAQAEVRKVLAAIGADVVDRELPVMQAHMHFDEDGNLHAEDVRSQLADHVTALVRATREKVAAV